MFPITGSGFFLSDLAFGNLYRRLSSKVEPVFRELCRLRLQSLTKRYGSVVTVDAIDLDIATGTYCCLLGPSGCGKTSTLHMVAGHGSDAGKGMV